MKREIEPGQEVEVGLFRPEDAPGISLAYLETYGETFPIGHVYDPEEVVRRNASDDQYTVVARTMRGNVVGLAGLFRHAPNPGVYEAGQLMVLKSYRKSHVAAEISRQILKSQPRGLGIPVVFAEAVCNHQVSQQLALQGGLTPTGLEVECMPSEAYKREGGVSRNVSLLLMFRVDEMKLSAIHIPEEYEQEINAILGMLGVQREKAIGGKLEGLTESQEFLLPDVGLARITVSRAGSDIQSIIDDAEAKAGHDGLVQMYLNLGEPGTPEAVSILRANGFFFGGLLPQWFGCDGLIMQKVPRPPDWDAMRLKGEMARAMRDYVRRDYEAVVGLQGGQS